jgi:group I intron endonuclease
VKLNYEDHSLKSGIYKILNTHTNRIYIGQASRFAERWYSHKRSLLGNIHQNKFLLNDFVKCREELGHDDFLEFHVLEVMEGSTKEERNKREEEWIAQHWDKQELCYNFKQKATSKERSVFSNTPEQTKELLSQAQKRLWQDPEERQKRIEGRDGQRRVKIGKTISEVWASMTEEQLQEINQKRIQLTKESWADPEIRQKRLKGIQANSWKVSIVQKEKITNDPVYHARLVAQGQASAKTYQMIDPQGQLVTIRNMTKFCRENKLVKSHMIAVSKGKAKSHKGWKKQIKDMTT